MKGPKQESVKNKKTTAAKLLDGSQQFMRADVSPEMRHVLQKEMSKKRIKGTSSDLGALAHVIIKDVETDRRLQVLTIARRLHYCCPLPEKKT